MVLTLTMCTIYVHITIKHPSKVKLNTKHSRQHIFTIIVATYGCANHQINNYSIINRIKSYSHACTSASGIVIPAVRGRNCIRVDWWDLLQSNQKEPGWLIINIYNYNNVPRHKVTQQNLQRIFVGWLGYPLQSWTSYTLFLAYNTKTTLSKLYWTVQTHVVRQDEPNEVCL